MLSTLCMDDRHHDRPVHATSWQSKEPALERSSSRDGIEESRYQAILALRGETVMLSEADLIVKRAALRWLTQQHPSWTRA